MAENPNHAPDVAPDKKPPLGVYMAPEPVLPPSVTEGSYLHQQYKQFLNDQPQTDTDDE